MQPGDSLTFTYQGKELKGVLVLEKDGQLTVKLSTGYNIIVPRQEVEELHAHPGAKQAVHKREIKQNQMLPKVTILHTGGTIASKVDYKTGATVAQFEPSELAAMFPELLHLANIESHLLANMQSDDMRFAHYNLMARAVLDEINKGVKGVIITHGTDTLHYTAAALSFALEGLNIPVVLVGSQRSSDRGSSDAGSNLLGAVRFILADTPGVFVAMHESSNDDSIAIYDGLHARKNHSSRRDAFAAVNTQQFARVTEKVEILDHERASYLKSKAGRAHVLPFKEDLKVGLWKVHPQSYSDELLTYEHYDALLIEGTGLGHAPISEIDEFTGEHKHIWERIKHLSQRMPVAMATQTIYGRVNMNVYSPGRLLQEAGVLGNNCDMHPETAFIKLAWILSNHKDHIKEFYGQNLRGEISARSPLEDSHKF